VGTFSWGYWPAVSGSSSGVCSAWGWPMCGEGGASVSTQGGSAWGEGLGEFKEGVVEADL
jgi:hypothetical protein